LQPERVDHGSELPIADLVGEIRTDEITEGQKDAAHVDRRHFLQQRGEREEQRAGEKEVRPEHERIRLEVRPYRFRSHAARIDEAGVHASKRSQRQARVKREKNEKRSEETAAEIVELGDGLGEEKSRRAMIDVLVNGAPCDGGDDRCRERSDDDHDRVE
jgi:hypothetical protein